MSDTVKTWPNGSMYDCERCGETLEPGNCNFERLLCSDCDDPQYCEFTVSGRHEWTPVGIVKNSVVWVCVAELCGFHFKAKLEKDKELNYEDIEFPV